MSKRKGTTAERDIVKKFWESGWAALRVAGSGSSQYPSPDVVAGRDGRRLAIECKITCEERKYFSEAEIRELKFFAQRFCCEAWVSIKFPKTEWYFFSLDDLTQTAKNYVVSIADIELKGFTFEQLLE